MANGNPYYIQPAGATLGQAFAPIGQALVARGQEQKQQAQQSQIQQEIQAAKGDPQRMAELAIKYPQMTNAIKMSIGLDTEQKTNEAKDFSRSVLANKDNPEMVMNLYQRRIDNIIDRGGDPTQTILSMQDYENNPQGELMALESTYASLDPQGYKAFSDRGLKTSEGTANIQDFEYYKQLEKTAPEDAKMFAKDVGLLPKDTTLSGTAEKSLLDAQDKFFQASTNSREYELLADDYDRFKNELPSGAVGTFSEFIKSQTGSQDEATELRRRFSKVRLSEALKYLPPGPATDRDVQEAFKGVPKENANPEQVRSFLLGAAKMAKIDAEFQEFKSNYISEKNSSKGMIKAWKEAIDRGEVDSINALRKGEGELSSATSNQKTVSWNDL